VHTYCIQLNLISTILEPVKTSLQKRIDNHNTGFYGSKTFTSNANDWILYLKIETQDYAHAIRIERKIKSMKSRVYIENLKKYSELVEKVFNNTL
jgi:putative endonuclease